MSRYEHRAHGEWRSLLAGPDGRVNLVMAPWQNRISGSGFTFEGQTVSLDPNTSLDPFPVHGNAWLLPWEIVATAPDRLTLHLVSDGPSLYRYVAEAAFHLEDDGSLATVVTVTNTGPRLPFGLGFHPNFTRTPDVLLKAPARTVTLQDARYLPTETVASSLRPDWDFNRAQPIPSGSINNEFGGWTGVADIAWPSWGVGCRLESPSVTRYLIYTPDTHARFFSFEPITHSVDAFNRPNPTTEGGLAVLQAGERLSLTTVFRPHLL